MDAVSSGNTDVKHNASDYSGRKTTIFGIEFRSKLEAEWAAFFTIIGIRWEYETIKANTRHGGYIPDFHLPDLRGGMICEVKPFGRAAEDFRVTNEKLWDACANHKLSGTVLRGNPWQFCVQDLLDVDHFNSIGGSHDMIFAPADDGEPKWDNGHTFCVCPYCWKAGYEFDGRGERVCKGGCGSTKVIDERHFGHLGHGDKGYSSTHPRIVLAAKTAAEIIRKEAR